MLLAQVACVIAFFAGAVSRLKHSIRQHLSYVHCLFLVQLKEPVKGKLEDILKSNYKGFDEYDSSETLMLTVMMMEVWHLTEFDSHS